VSASWRWAAAAITAAFAGCAAFGPGSIDESGAGVMRTGAPAPAAAPAAVTPGMGKAEVATALGKANVIRFDSGWEVWVYRWPGADRTTRGATELVVLFDAQGAARKVRLRPGYRS
jgi:hypothetical protein